MPYVANPPAVVRYGLRPVLGVTAAALVAYLLGARLGVLDGFMARWAGLVLEWGGAVACILRATLVRQERRAWVLIAAAVSSWALGDTIWRSVYYTQEVPPIPSLADPLWMGFYPFAYAGIAVLIRERARHVQAAIWVDGLIAALAAGALAAALVLPTLIADASGASLTINLTYVFADTVLLALVLFAFALAGWRLDRAWAWLGSALALFAISDTAYLYEVAHGTYSAGGPIDAGWSIALLFVGVAAWHTGPPRGSVRRSESWRSIALPVSFGFLALAIEVYDHFTPVTVLALALASVCLAAVLARMAMTFDENLHMLRATHEQATSDPLTGLGNRRRLLLDLDRALANADERDPMLLLLLDLDGFKHFNDTFGHPAGDALLARAGGSLATRIAPWGRAYRLGGDEFCALLRGDGRSERHLGRLAREALSESGEDYEITSSCGWATLPGEAGEASVALQLADSRMYEQKGHGRRAERRHPARPRHPAATA
jgi:diguanylate cyclase (GGDEF)-like protein